MYNYVDSKFPKTSLNHNGLITVEKADKRIELVVKGYLYSIVVYLAYRAIINLLTNNKRKLMFPLWLPFDIVDSNLFYIVFAYELVVLLQLSVIGSSIIILFFGFSIYLPSFVYVIEENFYLIDELTRNELQGFTENYVENKILNAVEDIITRTVKQHEIILTYV